MAAAVKTRKDIESLLRWCYVDELPKRKISSASGIWDAVEAYGQRGGIDVGQGAAQRYPHFGLPHPDAIAIEKAVSALPNTTIDWDQHYEIIAAELSPLVSVNDVTRADGSWRSTASGGSGYGLPGRLERRLGESEIQSQFRAISSEIAGRLENFSKFRDGKLRRGIRARPADKPRDVILVNTIDVEQLVYTHAIMGARPTGWNVTEMRAVPTLAERGPHAKIIGVCKGKNSYTSGSYCPLRWQPSPLKIIIARANYLAWHQALVELAATLSLGEFEVTEPEASPAPWIQNQTNSRLLVQVIDRQSALLLAPRRKLTNAPPQKPKNSKVRRIDFDKGEKS